MFRFTIRELVLLTLVVAMGVGWWVEHRTSLAWNARANAAARALHDAGQKAKWMGNGVVVLRAEGYMTVYGDIGQKASPDEN